LLVCFAGLALLGAYFVTKRSALLRAQQASA
jgi:hypothetical protein